MIETSPTSTAPGASTPRHQNALGRVARANIVQAAEQVLRHDGYHALSTRRVATACGISVGNLTYHFPNKALLVAAVMAAVCDRYDRQRPGIQPDKSDDPRDRLRHTIAWLFDDAVEPGTSALFLELWVLAKHHDFGAEIMERFYATAVGWLTKALATYFPASTPARCERAAYFILTLSEGSVAVFSRPVERPASPRDLVDGAVDAVLLILREAEIQE